MINTIYRLADKALDVLHHLSCRGSVWPEASATAVRELRDRITQRPSRSSGLPLSATETTTHAPHARESGTSLQPHYTSSSGLDPSSNGLANEPNHATSSTGLLQDQASSHLAQSTSSGTNRSSSAMDQATSASQAIENVQSISSAPSFPYNNMNTPVFDLGGTEWSNFIQANETLDSNASLVHGDGIDPYIGFDIPFWLGQDQYWDMLQDRN